MRVLPSRCCCAIDGVRMRSRLFCGCAVAVLQVLAFLQLPCFARAESTITAQDYCADGARLLAVQVGHAEGGRAIAAGEAPSAEWCRLPVSFWDQWIATRGHEGPQLWVICAVKQLTVHGQAWQSDRGACATPPYDPGQGYADDLQFVAQLCDAGGMETQVVVQIGENLLATAGVVVGRVRAQVVNTYRYWHWFTHKKSHRNGWLCETKNPRSAGLGVAMQKAIEVARLCVAAALTVAVLTVVVGLAVHALGWLGGQLNAADAIKSGVEWWNTQSWSIAGSEWIKSTGLSPAWIGYLLAMVVLAIFGLFSGRK